METVIPPFYRPGDTMRAWARERKTQEPVDLLERLLRAREQLLEKISWGSWDAGLSRRLDLLDYFLNN